jgi:hypothetical protein
LDAARGAPGYCILTSKHVDSKLALPVHSSSWLMSRAWCSPLKMKKGLPNWRDGSTVRRFRVQLKFSLHSRNMVCHGRICAEEMVQVLDKREPSPLAFQGVTQSLISLEHSFPFPCHALLFPFRVLCEPISCCVDGPNWF